MSRMERRRILRLLASAPLTAGFAWSPAEALEAHRLAQEATTTGQGFTPQFFTTREYETVRMLVDIIIPRDERSGSATDAQVPEFMDFLMMDGDHEDRQRNGESHHDGVVAVLTESLVAARNRRIRNRLGLLEFESPA